jgi:hypothetical protein
VLPPANDSIDALYIVFSFTTLSISPISSTLRLFQGPDRSPANEIGRYSGDVAPFVLVSPAISPAVFVCFRYLSHPSLLFFVCFLLDLAGTTGSRDV